MKFNVTSLAVVLVEILPRFKERESERGLEIKQNFGNKKKTKDKRNRSKTDSIIEPFTP